MKAARILTVAAVFGTVLGLAGADGAALRPLEPVSYAQVRIADDFWAPRIERNRTVSLRAAFKECEASGNIGNFRIAAGWEAGVSKGSHAYDSDVYKIIEGAAYSLAIHPDPELEAYVDRLIEAIAAAQQKDGYLNTHFTTRTPVRKWEMAPTEHELYCAGHLFEAGAAYAQATGKRKLLDVAIRLADHIDSIFGPGKRLEVSGHQEVELALVKLFKATGERRYFDLGKFFLDERGFAHGAEHRLPTPEEALRQDTVDPKNRRSVWSTRGYRQDHKPVVEQDEAVGHAVRAGYMYAAMVDIAAVTGDSGYRQAVARLWDNVAGKKLYLTGSVGTAQYGDEGFGTPYNLPNDKAYCETCAAVANIFWNYRMGLLRGESKYFDVLELGLYNGFLSGVSLAGDEFFYQNRLASKGGVRRDRWSDPACCPSNVVRLIPQVGNFIYARDAEGIFINLFAAGTASVPWKGGLVKLTQTTRYPWEGKVKVSLEPDRSQELTLNIRIPGWTGDGPVATDLYRFADDEAGASPRVRLAVNGESVGRLEIKNGYARVRRAWKKGDFLELDLSMRVRRVRANPAVEADRGRVALMRGPLVYCLESADHSFDVLTMALPEDSAVTAARRDDLLGGVTILQGQGLSGANAPVSFQAIPYYAWANRGDGAMIVWIAEIQKSEKNPRSEP
jgi:hypothetical protein